MGQRGAFVRNVDAVTPLLGSSNPGREGLVTDQKLTDQLASRIMGWKVSSDRFIKPRRSWLPKWKFAPLARLDDAFQLLDRSACTYKLERSSAGAFAVEVICAGRIGKASGEPKARAITFAIARALGIETPPDLATSPEDKGKIG